MRRLIVIGLILSAFTLATYWPTTHHDFVNFNDPEYVVKNDAVQSGISGLSVRWAFTTLYADNWHPVTWLSHMLDCHYFGLNPGAHHAVNLGFHVANTLLLFLVLRRLTGADWRSAFVAGLFALHPMHVESVAWISELKDVLSTFFGLLTLWSYARYAQQTTPARLVIALFFYALGLMSKQMLITFPVVFLLLDFWPLARYAKPVSHQPGEPPVYPEGKKSIGNLILEKWPFVALALSASIMTFIAHSKGGNVELMERWSIQTRIANALVSYSTYVFKAFWPQNLALFYPVHEIAVGQVIGSTALLVSLSVLAIAWARSRPYLFVGWFWFFVMLLPVIGLVQFGDQSMADRYTYLPFVGLFLAVTWWITDVLPASRPWRIGLASGAAVLLVASAVATRAQLQYWQNSTTLFARAIAVAPRNVLAHCYLGAALLDSRNLDGAMTEFKTALQIDPHYAYAHNYLGVALAEKGREDEAFAQFQCAVEILPNSSVFQGNLGIALLRKGRVDEAIAHFRKALEIQPDYAKGYDDLGSALLQTRHVDEAITNFQKALALHPKDVIVRASLGDALLRKGQLDEAIVQFQQAQALQPNNAYVLNNLAWIRAANAQDKYRNGADAVRLAERACQVTDYKVPVLIGTLAAAYAEAGRFDEAVATAEKARDLALSLGRKEVAEKNVQLIQLFQARQPYHEPAQ